jgi:aromatic ring-opening dioxygenase catalytic subunit (LigB family)
MASLAGVFAASHMPPIVFRWQHVDQARRDEVAAAYAEWGRRVAAARADVLVIVSPDHFVNFFLDNLPAVCIGIGEAHGAPPETWLKDLPYASYPGHRQFAEHLAAQAFAAGFEPALSRELTLDHGFVLPFFKAGLRSLPGGAIVPFIVNTVEPPYLNSRRCLAWGALIARAVASWPGPERVAVVATGGLSHSIGEVTMGAIDSDFDHGVLERLGRADDDALVAFLDRTIDRAGNGAQETRNWLVARGAAGGARFEPLYYRPIPEWYTGLGLAQWHSPPGGAALLESRSSERA